MQQALDYFIFDMMRADGPAVRWARLGMFSEVNTITILCWLMEGLYVGAFFTAHKRLFGAAFWIAYLAILLIT